MHRLRRGGQRGEALPRFGPGTGGCSLDNPQDNRSGCYREGRSLRLGQCLRWLDWNGLLGCPLDGWLGLPCRPLRRDGRQVQYDG
jgi:hypothetical protein